MAEDKKQEFETVSIVSARKDRRVALWDVNKAHPNGEIFVAGDKHVEAALTPEVQRAIDAGEIMKVSDAEKQAKAEAREAEREAKKNAKENEEKIKNAVDPENKKPVEAGSDETKGDAQDELEENSGEDGEAEDSGADSEVNADDEKTEDAPKAGDLKESKSKGSDKDVPKGGLITSQ